MHVPGVSPGYGRDLGEAAGPTGAAPSAVQPDHGASVVMGLLHGFLLQRVACGLTDTAQCNVDIRALLHHP
ncbi:hypothetical protein ABVG11_00575 [Streptomyces sp. HD1123-B1]|uniref:hypothetical protein n=1 Tax=Streptomyces huangiella TaxID=3228804 RepID=UPI003D7D5B87